MTAFLLVLVNIGFRAMSPSWGIFDKLKTIGI